MSTNVIHHAFGRNAPDRFDGQNHVSDTMSASVEQILQYSKVAWVRHIYARIEQSEYALHRRFFDILLQTHRVLILHGADPRLTFSSLMRVEDNLANQETMEVGTFAKLSNNTMTPIDENMVTTYMFNTLHEANIAYDLRMNEEEELIELVSINIDDIDWIEPEKTPAKKMLRNRIQYTYSVSISLNDTDVQEGGYSDPSHFHDPSKPSVLFLMLDALHDMLANEIVPGKETEIIVYRTTDTGEYRVFMSFDQFLAEIDAAIIRKWEIYQNHTNRTRLRSMVYEKYIVPYLQDVPPGVIS